MRDGGLGGRGRGGRSQERNPEVRLRCVQSKGEEEHHESHWSAGSQAVKETPKPSAVQSRGCCVWQGRGQLSTGARPRGYMYTHQCSDGRLRPAAHPCVNCTAILHLEQDGRKETGQDCLRAPWRGSQGRWPHSWKQGHASVYQSRPPGAALQATAAAGPRAESASSKEPNDASMPNTTYPESQAWRCPERRQSRTSSP